MKKFVALTLAALLSLASLAEAATLTWQDNSTNEGGFNVYRKTEACSGASAPFVTLAAVPSNSVQYVDNTVVQGQAYCYKVTAFNTGGESNPTNTVDFTVPFSVPLPPSGLAVRP